MTTQNWSASLFSYNGQVPTYLPTRIRLPDGFTRYTSSCSLEEILSAGYIGPFIPPSVTNDTVLSWNSTELCFELVDKNSNETKASDLTDREVRQWCSAQLKDLPSLVDSPDFDQNYKTAWSDYKVRLLDLLNTPSTTLLTFEDLPAIPIEVPNHEIFNRSIGYNIIENNLSQWKEQFETYGFCFSVPVEAKPYFSIPSDWIAGSEPIPSGTSNYFANAVPSQLLS